MHTAHAERESRIARLHFANIACVEFAGERFDGGHLSVEFGADREHAFAVDALDAFIGVSAFNGCCV